jgi:hypothetical protein
MKLPSEIPEGLDAVNRCFDLHLPASLAIALDDVADTLGRHPVRDREAVIENLKAASRAAFPGQDIPLAREHYDVALAEMGLRLPRDGRAAQA